MADMTTDVIKIHIHSSTDKSTLGYLQFMWDTMRRLANHPNKLSLTVHCLGPSATDRALELLAGDVRTINVGRPSWMKPDEPLAGSSGHAACVESALALTNDGSIHVIADSDTVMLAKGWDDYVRLRLLVDGIGLLGVTYEDIGGFSSGASASQTYKRIPNVVWMAMSPKYSWVDLKVQPFKGRDEAVTTPELSTIYNLPVGHRVLRDVAWQIPQYIHQRHIKYDGLPQLKPSKNALVLKGLNDYHEEYHADGRPFVAHHRGSLRHGYRSDKISKTFYDTIDTWLRQEDGVAPRWGGTDSLLEPIETMVEQQHFVSPSQQWAKVSMDGVVIQPKRIPSATTLTAVYTTDRSTRHIRLEGNASSFELTLPDGRERPHHVIVRNMLMGPVIVTTGLKQQLSEIVPAGKIKLLLVDVDGVVNVE